MAASRARSVLLGVTLLAVGGLSACGGDGEPSAPAATAEISEPAPAETAETSEPAEPPAGEEAAATATGTLDAQDQTSDGSSVVVASVTLEGAPNGGWIALHEDDDGAPGPVRYFAKVPEGTQTNVGIVADRPLASGTYWPMLHVDDGVLGAYEFGETEGADPPVLVNGQPVMTRIQVTVG